jgi:hypothetical protein
MQKYNDDSKDNAKAKTMQKQRQCKSKDNAKAKTMQKTNAGVLRFAQNDKVELSVIISDGNSDEDQAKTRLRTMRMARTAMARVAGFWYQLRWVSTGLGVRE